MPLPPELQARLSKRGLIKQGLFSRSCRNGGSLPPYSGEGGEKEKGRGGESSATVSKPPLDYVREISLHVIHLNSLNLTFAIV